jgi:putative molybdopterin biosynthesis protein
LFVEDYYLLGKRETVERADVETIVRLIKSADFAALVKEIPGYDTSHTGEVTNVTDVIG